MEEFEGFQGFRNNWREDQIATFAERSQLARQLKSWYWALATLTAVGNEDYYPKTNVEVVFQIFCTLLGASIYAGFIGNLASLMSDGNSASAVFRTKMEHVKHYLGYRQIADDLKDRVVSSYMGSSTSYPNLCTVQLLRIFMVQTQWNGRERHSQRSSTATEGRSGPQCCEEKRSDRVHKIILQKSPK